MVAAVRQQQSIRTVARHFGVSIRLPPRSPQCDTRFLCLGPD